MLAKTSKNDPATRLQSSSLVANKPNLKSSTHSVGLEHLGEHKTGIHKRWRDRFRTADNEHHFSLFLDRFFEEIADRPPLGNRILDAGCGSGEKSLELARRGLACVSVDTSNWAVRAARKAFADHGLSNKIDLRCEDLARLSFDDKRFDYVLCWGVLMHIRDLADPLDELARVVAPGGFLIINEINMNAYEARFVRRMAKLSAKTRSMRSTPDGIAIERQIGQDTMFLRHADLKALRAALQMRGFTLDAQFPDQLTEMYKYFNKTPIRYLLQKINEKSREVPLPKNAYFSQTLVFRKNQND